MSKTQDYLQKKKDEKSPKPKMWVIYSDRHDIEKPKEISIKEIMLNHAHVNYEHIQKSLTRYMFDVSPYEIDIVEGDISASADGYGSGFGDLWAWTYYCTLSKEDADIYYEKELKRVTDKYLTPKDENVIVLSKDDIKTFMDDVYSGTGWSDTSYKICRFIDIDPTDGI